MVTTPTTPSPAIRVLRTVIQAVAAAVAAVPAAVVLLGLPADTTAQIVGIAGALVIIISAVQNGVEAKIGRTALATSPNEPQQP